MNFKDSSRQKLTFGESTTENEISANQLSEIIFSENRNSLFYDSTVKNVI